MAASKKKTKSKQTSALKRKKQANDKRKALTDKLKQDLGAAREALRAANIAAREELKLAKAAAKAEVRVLKDLLAAARKREQEFLKLGEIKAKMLLTVGKRWEKKQINRIQKSFKIKRSKA